MTDKAELNQLKLTITNVDSEDISLSQNQPFLSLDFSQVLTTEVIQRMQVSAEGWTFQNHDDILALIPSQALTIVKNQSIIFTLTEITADGQPRSNDLIITPTDAGGHPDDYYSLKIFLINPPSPQQKDLNNTYFQDRFRGTSEIFISETSEPIENTLALIFSNPQIKTPLVPPDKPWGADPVFTVSFIAGDYIGALAKDNTTIKDIDVNVLENYGTFWDCNKNTQGASPFWELKPKKDVNHEILGTGEKASVTFEISNIVADTPEGTTLMYIQYANIPGFNDGVLALAIDKKKPTPGILKFISMTPENTQLGQPVQLSWQTFAVSYVELSYIEGTQTITKSSQTGEIKLNETSYQVTSSLQQSTTYTLDAYDSNGAKINSKQTTISIPAPEITSFSLAQASISATEFPVQVPLKWTTTNASYCTLSKQDKRKDSIYNLMVRCAIRVRTLLIGLWRKSSKVEERDELATVQGRNDASLPANTDNYPINLPAVGEFPYRLEARNNGGLSSRPQEITLKVEQDFEVIQNIPVGSWPVSLAVSGQYLYVSNQSSKNVSVINTQSNQVETTIAVGDNPCALAVSGQYLYVANFGSNNVSVINTQSYQVEKTIAVGSWPSAFAVSGQYLYVANPGSNNVSVIDTQSNQVERTIAVGSTSYLFAVSGQYLYLYAANSGSDNVSVINTQSYQVEKTIAVGTTPNALAVSGQYVYVANFNSDNVSVINTQSNQVEKTIAVGSGPWSFAVSEQYLYVANRDSDNVSVINTQSYQVEKTIAVGSKPWSLAVSGQYLYVANRDSDNVSVIDLSIKVTQI